MANNVGLRPALLSKGYSNDDIGYDQNTGYVQLRNKNTGAYENFMKPELNLNGTTYTSQQNFDNAYNQFQRNQRTQQQNQLTDQYIQQATNPTPRANPHVDQYTQLISQIQNIMNRPTQDPYSTPQYAAAQAQAQRSAQQGIRAAQEALGAAGFGRSTALGNAAQRAQNDANEYLMTQVVPSIQNQLQAQRQTEISNLINLMNPVYNLLSREDTQQRNQILDLRDVIDIIDRQNQNQFTNDIARRQDARAEAGLTGYYMPEGAREAINNILGLKQQAEQSGVTADQMAQYRAAADAERNRLYQMGIDPSIVGFDADYATAARNVANFRGIPTMQTNMFDYQKQQDALAQKNLDDEKAYRRERDSEEDRRWWAQYEQDGRKFAASQGLQWAQLNQREREFWADQAYKQAVLARENDPNSLDNQYKKAQIDSLRSKIEPQDAGIDEYDLLVVEDMAKQRGINLNKPKADQVRNFVATMKGQYGWTVDETKAVENYLMSKGSTSIKATKDKAAQKQAINDAKSTIYSQDPYKYPWQR